METSTEDKDLICGMTADERSKLQRGLTELADTMPPRVVWQRIREQAEAEGLIGRPRSGRPSQWYAFGGLAAALLLVAVIVPGLKGTTQQSFPVLPDTAEPTNTAPLNVLEALRVESRRLENDLRSLPTGPRVVRAGTRATILDIEDRIAAIDYQLSDSEIRLTPEEVEIFWRERVRLMNSLVRLRFAQAQRTAF